MTRNVPSQVAHHRARVAGMVSRGADPTDVEAARVELQDALEQAAIDRHIDELVARWPKMTPEQADRIRRVFAYGPAEGGSTG